jgi:hypothetical protein
MLLKGLPLVPGIGSSARPAPADWWAIEVPLPNGAVPGGEALVVMRDSSRRVAAVVLRAPSVGSFGATAPGLVAVPPEDAVAVAQAVGEQRATVLLRP